MRKFQEVFSARRSLFGSLAARNFCFTFNTQMTSGRHEKKQHDPGFCFCGIPLGPSWPLFKAKAKRRCGYSYSRVDSETKWSLRQICTGVKGLNGARLWSPPAPADLTQKGGAWSLRPKRPPYCSLPRWQGAPGPKAWTPPCQRPEHPRLQGAPASFMQKRGRLKPKAWTAPYCSLPRWGHLGLRPGRPPPTCWISGRGPSRPQAQVAPFLREICVCRWGLSKGSSAAVQIEMYPYIFWGRSFGHGFELRIHMLCGEKGWGWHFIGLILEWNSWSWSSLQFCDVEFSLEPKYQDIDKLLSLLLLKLRPFFVENKETGKQYGGHLGPGSLRKLCSSNTSSTVHHFWPS